MRNHQSRNRKIAFFFGGGRGERKGRWHRLTWLHSIHSPSEEGWGEVFCV